MNPYLNSINGFGGGFIAFWPSQTGAVVEAFKDIVRFCLYITQARRFDLER